MSFVPTDPIDPTASLAKPSPFVVFTEHAIPATFDESLSYQQALYALNGFIQKNVVPVINENAHITEQQTRVIEELQDYVNHYFDNLDVQDEINTKLDEMAESGELEEIISAYLNSNAVLGFNTVADMKLSTGLTEGSYAKTLGRVALNDNGGGYYKIRNITTSDVIDDYTIVAISETLVAELIRSNDALCFDTLNDMVTATNIIEGSKAKTLGCTSLNDGGGAYYKIRELTNADTPDGYSLVAIGTSLVAELIINDYVTPEMFGAIGDGETDDTNAFALAITKGVKIKGSNNKTYNINNITTNDPVDIEGCNFTSASEESATDVKMLFRTYSTDVKFNNCSFSSTSDQIPVINQLNGQNTGLASNVMCIRLEHGGLITNCKFDNVYAIDTRGGATITNCIFNEVEMGVYISTDGDVTVDDCKFYMNRLVNSMYYHAFYVPGANKFIANNIMVKEVGTGQCGDHFHFRTSDGTGGLTTPYAIITNCVIEGDLTYGYLSQNNNATVTFDNLSYKGATNGAFINGNVGTFNINNSYVNCAGETLFKCYNKVSANNSTFNCTATTTQLLSRCHIDLKNCVINAVGLHMNPDVGNLVINFLGTVFNVSTINSLNVAGNTNFNNILGCVYNITSGTLVLGGTGYINATVNNSDYPTAMTTVENYNCYTLAVLQSNRYYKKLEAILT